MGSEARKNRHRREQNGDSKRFLSGSGIDIGCGNDALEGAVLFDKSLGDDAHDLSEFDNEFFDFVHSSHCLEHLERPDVALKEWWRVVKKGGHMVVTVPHFALYEKRRWPSIFNTDHKKTFTVKSFLEMVYQNLSWFQVLRVQINDEGFNYNDVTSDQTLKDAQAEIELILRKPFLEMWCDR